MPNWCINRVIVTGDATQVASFAARCGGVSEHLLAYLAGSVSDPVVHSALGTAAIDGTLGEFTLGGVVPMPEALRDTRSPNDAPDDVRAALVAAYGADNWYDWAVHNWGTKWDVTDADVVDPAPGRFEVRFDTAWAPPVAWAEHASAVFGDVEVRVEFVEPGMGVQGWLTVARGAVVAEGDVVPWAAAYEMDEMDEDGEA